MRKIIVFTHLSLDGVMQAPGGPTEDPSNGFKLGGWSMAYGDETSGRIFNEIMSRNFDLLLGRRTYEIWAAYWPFAGDHLIANAFNKATKYVATRTLKHFDWKNSQRIEGDAVDGVRRLKESNGPEIHIWGSGNFLQSLITADLVDEYYLFIYPVVLGGGKRLFENGLPPRKFTLAKTQSTTDGVLVNIYHPSGPLPASVS